MSCFDDNFKAHEPKYKDSEILEIFSEIKETLPVSYDERVQEKTKLIEERARKYAAIDAETDDEERRYFLKAVADARNNYEERLRAIDIQLARLRRYLRLINGTPIPKGAITGDLIQAAKEVPIETIFDQEFRRSGNKLVGLCPFIEEKTPSFFIYRDTNRCWCFGCQQGFGVIDTFMKLNNCSFNEAVLALTRSI